MTETVHPDVALMTILASGTLQRDEESKLFVIHELCYARFDEARRDFSPDEIERALEESGAMGKASFNKLIYRNLVQAWQDYANIVGVPIATTPVPGHPDAALPKLLLAVEASPQVRQKMISVHELCRARFDAGIRSFQPAEVGKTLKAAGVMAESSYLNSTNTRYSDIGKVWQGYADAVDLALNSNAPSGHPDSVLLTLLADPTRRGGSAGKLRSLYRICKSRYDRGELNFSGAAVGRDAFDAGIFSIKEGLLGTGGSGRYSSLLEAWQALSDERVVALKEDVPAESPDEIFSHFLRARAVKSSTLDQLQGMQEVCQTRFDNGEYDFGTSAMARALVEAKVFASDIGLVTRLKASERWSPLLQAWQARADALWIDSDPDLPPHNPHSVFRRLRAKNLRADMLETLLGLHRVCYKEYSAGQKDFSTLTLGKILAARGILAERSLYNTTYDELRILANAWDEYARPWLTKDGESPPLVQQKKRKSHSPDLEWVRREYPQFEEWRVLASGWLQAAPGALGHRLSTINAFFEHYLTRDDVPDTPAALLRRGVRLPDFGEMWRYVASSNSKATRNNHLYDFFGWVLLRNFSDEADNGVLMVSPAFCNPLSHVKSTRDGGGPSQSVRSPLPYGYIHTLRRLLAPGLTFREWTFAQAAQGVEEGGLGRPSTDWYEVERSAIDEDDLNCVWRVRTLGKRKVYQMWSPVRWVALLVKLLLPLRTGQVRMLDSGESDTWKYSAGQWMLNDHPLAEKSQRAVWQQGVLRRVIDQTTREGPSTVLYISTNKTADMDKDGPSKGYVMPWFAAPDQLDDVYGWLERLRDWQEKYNPIKRRTKWSELGAKHTHAKTADQLASYSPTCFLFRMPEDLPGLRSLPVTDSALSYVWGSLLEGLQDLLAKKGEVHPGGHPIIFMGRDEKGRICFNDFPLHSLRVSLITAFALDGGVPFAIMQKLVGHSRLLMTLYYIKPGQTRTRKVLNEAAEKLNVNKEESIHSFLLDTDHDVLVNKGIFNNSAAAAAAIPMRKADRNPAGWMLMHHGLCLVGGNVSENEDNKKIGGCYNGGPQLSAGVYGPVPGGSRNCIRCRWFGTEPLYLPALAAHFNMIAYHFDESRNRAVDAEKTYQSLLREKAEQELKGGLFASQKLILQAERIMETALREFSDHVEDLVATWRLIERCRDVLNSAPTGGLQLIIQGELTSIEAVFEETESELLQLCGVCDDLELYPDLQADKAILRRSQLLDSALYNEGLPAMFLRLSQGEQLKVGNAFMRSLSRSAAPDSPFVGQRKVVQIIDAGGKLGESLGISLLNKLSELKLDSMTSSSSMAGTLK